MSHHVRVAAAAKCFIVEAECRCGVLDGLMQLRVVPDDSVGAHSTERGSRLGTCKLSWLGCALTLHGTQRATGDRMCNHRRVCHDPTQMCDKIEIS